MNREEILEKSRIENKNQDIYEKEILRRGQSVGALAAGILATIFFIIQIFTGGGMNYGLYAVVFVIPAGSFTVKAVNLKRRHEILVAACYWLMVLLCSGAHIYQLVTGAAAL